MFTRITALSALLLAQQTSAGFVTTSGTSFQLDGANFSIFGTNAYWASETKWTDAQLATIFTEMKTSGYTVCRIWGFNDVTSAPSSEAYYQLWENGKPTINTGESGLEYFDKVVAAAKKAGVKLVVPFVNNWSDYGGMDVYVKSLGGKYHDEFYTSETVKSAYKAYMKAFVSRYKADDTIMSWQVCNECRCAGSQNGLPTSGTCTTATITKWMTEMSAYIKSIDSKHLVSSGDEGHFNTKPGVYTYSGYDGVDFDANLDIATIDYGAYHAYPDAWGIKDDASKEYGLQWIKDHVASGKKANKPVIMEEYGVKTKDAATYQAWSDLVYELDSNMQMWQFGVKSLSTADDGYTIFSTDPMSKSTIEPAAAKFAKKNGSGDVAGDASSEPSTKTTKPSATTAKPSATTTKPSTPTTKPATKAPVPSGNSTAPATSKPAKCIRSKRQ